MRRRLALAAAACLLVVAGVAVAATEHQVSLTATGPQPAQLKVGWGDTVVFTNSDKVAHTLFIQRLNLTQEIPAGGTFSRTFDVKKGAYPYRQKAPSKVFLGTITVEVAGTLTFQVPTQSQPFGKPLAVRGTSPYPGAQVKIDYRAPGSASFSELTTVTAGADGGYTATLSLARGGRLVASTAGGQLRSAIASVEVVPRIALSATPRRPAAGRFVRLLARISPPDAASTATLERYDGERKRWLKLRTVGVPTSGLAPFSVRAAAGANRFRVVISRSAARAGYAAATSAVLVVRTT